MKPTRRRRLWIVVLVLTALLVLPAISFVRAMTYPGTAPVSVLAVEWVRDNGGGPIVDTVETWLYSRNAPSANGKPSDRLGVARPPPGPVTPRTHASAGTGPALPRIPLLSGVAAGSGEGRWRVARRSANGPALYTSWFRPDPAHLPLVVAAALIPAASDVLHLVAGTREPVAGQKSPEGFEVPASARSRLVATFNAGFKTQDTHGGWYANGRTSVPLRSGQASLVILRNGQTRVGAWGRDVTMSPEVVAVRQNLQLVVEQGRPVAGLNRNANGRWGTGRNQYQYTARSGVGTDAHGDLIYLTGRNLNLAGLAQAMAKAGMVTGMELDIHPEMITFNAFAPPTGSGRPTGSRLLASMKRPTDRYLVPDQRDYFYVTMR